ncbi:PQQ-binding-like beta-propeller repeat protein [Kitasatospora sp. NPDC093558]|uniref:outer membrane protein assembly factor BamB family protein n=1 Tax=Kitasatospora sp. NPDC093558 TaxID=3155201 RepID=UPI003418679E
MAGDHPTPGAGETPGSGPQDNRGVSFGRQPGVDPAAVADQMTQLDGSAIPGPAAPAGPPAQPPAPPAAAPPTGPAYAPTAAAFPSQAPPPPAAAPVGPYDPVAGGGQTYGGGYGYPQEQQQGGYTYPAAPVPAAPKQRNPVMLWGGIIGGVLAIAIVAALIVLIKQPDSPDNSVASTGGTTSGTSGDSGSSTTTGTTSGSSTAGGNSGGTGGTGGTGGGAGYNVAWSVPKAADSDGSNQMLGVWVTDKVTVRVDANGIRAYNVSDGKAAWTIPVPAGAKELCAASYGVNSKSVGAVAFNTGDSDCSTMGAVDLTTGKMTWSVKVSNDRISSPTLAVTDKVVAIGGRVVGAVNIDNGSTIWSWKPRDNSCTVTGRAAGAQIVISDRCYESTPKSQLYVVDSETGAQKSTPLALAGNIEAVDKVVSDQPLVVLITNGTNGDYVLPFDKADKPGTAMSVKEAGSDSLRLSGQGDGISQNVVSGNILYVQVTGSKDAVNAYDLTSGKRLWSASNPTANQDIRLVSGIDKDGKVRAILTQGYKKPARLVTLSPTDGSTTDLGTLAMPDSLDIGAGLNEYRMPQDATAVYGFARYGSDSPLTKWAKK